MVPFQNMASKREKKKYFQKKISKLHKKDVIWRNNDYIFLNNGKQEQA